MAYVASYFKSGWNILDMMAIVVYIGAFLAHFIWCFTDDQIHYYSSSHDDRTDPISYQRVVDDFNCPLQLPSYLQTIQSLYSLSFLGFVGKQLQYFVIFEKIGTKVLVIQKCAWDVGVFSVIFVIFALSYGVLMQTIAFPNEWRNEVIWDGLFYRPFFHIYGELFLGQYITKKNGSKFSFRPFYAFHWERH